MTVTGRGVLERGSGRAALAQELGTQLGPASYVTGGFNITLELTQTPIDFQVWTDDSGIIAVSDQQTKLVCSLTTVGGLPVINVQVWLQVTSGAGPNAWSQLSMGSGALAAVTFRYRATAPGGS